MIVQNNNTLTIRDLAKNRAFTLVKRSDKVVITFTDEFGEKFTVATIDRSDIQQVIGFLLG